MAILVSQATQDGNALSLTSSDNSNTFYGSSYADQITYIGTNNFVVADISNLDQIVLNNLSSNLDYTIQTAGNNVVINLTGGKKVTFQAIANGESFTVNFGSTAKQLTVTRSSDVFAAAGRTLTSTPQSIPLSLKASESGGTLTIDGTPLGALVINLNTDTLTDSGTAVTLSSGTLASATNVTFASNTITSATITGDNTTNTLQLADGGNTVSLTLSSVESIVGGTGADLITLTNAVTATTVVGGTGADVLTLLATATNTISINDTDGISVTGGTYVDTITFTSGVTQNTTIVGGTGADVLTLLATATNTISINDTDGISVTGGTYVDTITFTTALVATTVLGGTGADVITLAASVSNVATVTGGLGADVINLGATTTGITTVDIAAGDSTSTIGGTGNAGTASVDFDAITSVTTGATANAKDKIDVVGTATVAAAATVNGTDSTLTIGGFVVGEHTISSTGLTTFVVANAGAAQVVTSDASLAAVLQYLSGVDIGDSGQSLVFQATYATSTRGSTTHSFLYTQNTANKANTSASDGFTLVDFVGVTLVGLETTASTNDVTLFIA